MLRVADLIAYVNHDIDDCGAGRACLRRPTCRRRGGHAGPASSARIARMVKDVVVETDRGDSGRRFG